MRFDLTNVEFRKENGGAMFFESFGVKFAIRPSDSKFSCWNEWFPNTAKTISAEVSAKVTDFVTAYFLADTVHKMYNIQYSFNNPNDFNISIPSARLNADVQGETLALQIDYNGCSTQEYKTDLISAANTDGVVYLY